uniref:K Homology domain-containing protein n=1 Tax=Globisporangium ultimum (strain ATCC 200006 / CBS 805.95 / DAOM BR144) TaxID=431595 RepID=K3XA73_GLOUD
MNSSKSGSVLGDYPGDSKAHVRAALDRAQQQRRDDASSHHHHHHHPYDHNTTRSRHGEDEHSRRRYGVHHSHAQQRHESSQYESTPYPPYPHHYHQQRAYEGVEERGAYDPHYRRPFGEERTHDAAYDPSSYTRRSAATTRGHHAPARSSAHADTKPRSWDGDGAYYPPPRVLAARPILSSPPRSSYPPHASLSEGLPPRRSSTHHPPAYPQSHNHHYDHHQEHSFSYDHQNHSSYDAHPHQYPHYEQQHEYDDDGDEQHRRVVKHEHPRARNKRHAIPQVALPSSSSYRSTSNSSIPDEDDASFHDDDEEYDDDDADLHEDDNDVDNLSPHERLSQLTPEMYEDSELHSDVRHMLHMLIPASAMGCLIGSRGVIMRKLNAQTKCTLSVRDANAFSVKDDRVLRIYGKPKGICLTQHLVIEKIRAHRAKKGDPNYIALDLDDDDLVLPLPESSVTKSMAVAVSRPNPNQKQKSVAATVSDARIGSVTWLLPVQDVGKILGQRGAILSAIARDTGTKIHITPIAEMARGSTERAVTISGPPDGVETARQAIEAKAGGRPEDPGFNGKCGQYFAIPYTSAGALIGLQGTTVKQIAEKTGARLQIPSSEDLPLGILNRTLHIQGNKKQVEAAYAIACRKVRKELQEQAMEVREIVPDITIKILLPTRIAGFLLEQHGRLIREISEKSGAHAHFLPPHDDDMRLCAIKGEMSRVFRAERLILQFIAGDAIATKRSGGGDTVVLSVPQQTPVARGLG